jgi:mannopine transport system permease protein
MSTVDPVVRGSLRPGASWLLLAPLLVVLVFAFFWPITHLLSRSFLTPELSLQNYERLAGDALYWRIFGRTFWIAFWCCVLSLVLGYPVAYAMARLSGWRAVVVAVCVLIPLWTSVLVRSYAWVFLLQRQGVVNSVLLDVGIVGMPLRMLYTEGAVLMAMTHVLLPFMILPIYATLRGIPHELERAARNLGAGRLQAFLRVTLPLSLPGVSTGVLFVFILALGFYITPAMVGGPRTLMVGTLIAQQVTDTLDWKFAGAISTVLLVLTLGAAVIFQRALSVEKLSGHAN